MKKISVNSISMPYYDYNKTIISKSVSELFIAEYFENKKGFIQHKDSYVSQKLRNILNFIDRKEYY